MASGKEPVREWLRTLSKSDKVAIGTDIQTVEYGWPIGMPVCRPLGKGLYEVRTTLYGRIARILFCMHRGHMDLLHGFIKKTQKTPAADMKQALVRQRALEKCHDQKKENQTHWDSICDLSG